MDTTQSTEKKAKRKRCSVMGCEKLAVGPHFCVSHGNPYILLRNPSTPQKNIVLPKKKKRKEKKYNIYFCLFERATNSTFACFKSLCCCCCCCCEYEGGGNRCQFDGCEKNVRDRTGFCRQHGGGRRCE
jgi:hypothetical protein